MNRRVPKWLALLLCATVAIQTSGVPALFADDFTVPGGASPSMPPNPGGPSGGAPPSQNPPGADKDVQANIDPVHVHSGDFTQPRQDLFVPGRGLSVDLTFTYRSRSAYNGVFGYGWDLTYNRRLKKLSNSNVVLLTGDNRKEEFTWNGTGYDAPPGVYGQLSANMDGTSTLRHPHGRAETFDVNGNLIRLDDRNGHALTFGYSATPIPIQGQSDYFVTQTTGVLAREYRLEQLTDTVGRAVSFAYEANGRLASVTYLGRTVTYAYDPTGSGDLLSVTMPPTPDVPAGAATTYAYTNHNLITLTDPKGQTYLTNVYDSHDCVRSQTYGTGTTYVAYASSSVCPTIDGSGDAAYSLKLTPLLAAPGQTLTVTWTAPAGAAFSDQVRLYQRGAADSAFIGSAPTNGVLKGAATFTLSSSAVADLYEVRYGPGGISPNVATSNTVTVAATPAPATVDVTDRKGFRTNYTFDAAGHITRMEQFTDGNPAGEPTSYVTTHTYDNQGNRTETVFPRGNRTLFTYDNASADPRARGNLLEIRRKPLAGSLAPDLVTTFTYEPNFQLTKTLTDPRGNVTTYTYDYELGEPNKGNLRKITFPSVVGQTIETMLAYDAFGQVETVTDPNGNVTRYGYDPATGNLTNIINGDGTPDAATTQMSYDAFGNVTAITDANGHATGFAYNALNQLTQVTAPPPFNFLATYHYDANSNLREVNRQTDDPNNPSQTTTYAYTTLDQLQTITDALGHATFFGYDANGNRTSIQDANTQTTAYQFDERDLLQQATDANTGVTAYTYDDNGNLQTIRDANTNTTSYAYDDFDRLERTTYADNSFETYTYDAASNLTEHRTPNNALIQFAYDPLNRLDLKTYPDTTTVDYAYDPASRLSAVQDSLTQISLGYQYDPLNRVTAVSNQQSALSTQVSYRYDGVGNRTQLTAPSGATVAYAYDALSRASAISSQQSAISNYTYDFLSRRIRLERPTAAGTLRTGYGYDAANRLTQLTHALLPPGGGGSPPRRKPIRRELGGLFPSLLPELAYAAALPTLASSVAYTYDNVGNRVSAISNQQSAISNLAYGYDSLYQVTGVSGDQGHGYTYDPVGNRLTADGTVYVPNPLNQYATVNGVNFTHDLNGNVTNDGTKTYTYDFENRLTAVTGPGLNVTYAYDPFGRRIEKVVNGTLTRYLYDGDQVIEERNAANQVIASYVYGPGIDEPLTMTRNGQTYYFFQDGLGSVTDLTNAAGEVIESYQYDPYGQPTPAVSAIGNPYRFTGREFDQETGLYYYRARHYSPTLGRFLQRDPLGYLPGINSYEYVMNNPQNFLDPFGYMSIPSPKIILMPAPPPPVIRQGDNVPPRIEFEPDLLPPGPIIPTIILDPAGGQQSALRDFFSIPKSIEVLGRAIGVAIGILVGTGPEDARGAGTAIGPKITISGPQVPRDKKSEQGQDGDGKGDGAEKLSQSPPKDPKFGK